MKSPKSNSSKPTFVISNAIHHGFVIVGGKYMSYRRAEEALNRAREKRLGKDSNRGTD